MKSNKLCHSEPVRTLAWEFVIRPPCVKGAVSKADWGIVRHVTTPPSKIKDF